MISQLKESIKFIEQGEQLKKEGQALIDCTMETLKELPLNIISYLNYHSKPALHAFDEKELVKLFPTYIISPFDCTGSEYKTKITAKLDGWEIFAISRNPMPMDAEKICISKPPLEAIV